MKKFTLTLLFATILGLIAFAQDTESYTALKVTGANVPVIDGTIDAIWDNVEIVPLTKVPEQGGEIHPNITVPDPDSSDYYAEIGMLWNEAGIFFLFNVTDDIVVIYEDYDTGNDTPADKWWWDDNINILFSKDLLNESFTQWEFAWQPGIDQEEKLSSDDWLNAALIDISLVSSAWHNEGDLWQLETFISWGAFDDGNGYDYIGAGEDIYLEARARDDDDDGEDNNSWETMFQWSTVNYNVENDGNGMGTVTLSGTEVQAPSGLSEEKGAFGNLSVYPNPSNGISEMQLNLENAGNVNVSVFDLSGKLVSELTYENKPAGDNLLPLSLESLQPGVYFLNVRSDNASDVVKYIRQ